MVRILTMANKNELAVPTFVQQWREFRGLTQEKLAGMVGFQPPSISQLENGKQGFSDKSLAKFAKALGCTPADLLAYDPSKPASFWPLFQEAEALTGRDRQRVLAILKAALAPFEG